MGIAKHSARCREFGVWCRVFGVYMCLPQSCLNLRSHSPLACGDDAKSSVHLTYCRVLHTHKNAHTFSTYMQTTTGTYAHRNKLKCTIGTKLATLHATPQPEERVIALMYTDCCRNWPHGQGRRAHAPYYRRHLQSQRYPPTVPSGPRTQFLQHSMRLPT